MSFWIRFFLAVWLVAAIGGCAPSSQDEEKEPHYVLGLSRVNAMDYQGAIEAFEESLEVNPHSAAAHYQLALLYDNQESDPAAAIYHYEQYLKYDPGAGNADLIRQRITTCKQQLAADVLPLPSTPVAEQQLQKLMDQNRQLQAQVDSLKATLKQWNDWYAAQAASKGSSSLPQDVTVPQQTESPGPAPAPLPQPQPQPQPQIVNQPYADARPAEAPHADSRRPAAAARGRTHVVERGETAMAICRRYGIRLNELEAANPDMNPARIRVGEVLTIP